MTTENRHASYQDEARGSLITLAIAAVSLGLILNFLEFFPNGWDQAEYSWCVSQNYLPHSPYILYFLLGKLFYWVAGDAALGLAVLSCVAGVASLLVYDRVIKRQFKLRSTRSAHFLESRFCAPVAVLLLGTNYLYIRQSGTQEVYVLQLFLLLLAAYLLLDGRKDRSTLSGIACGCAIATHSASLFVFPSLVLLAVQSARSRQRPWLNTVLDLTFYTAITTVAFFSLLYFLLPKVGDGAQWTYFSSYARGIAEGVDYRALTDPSYLLDSFRSVLRRLTSSDIPYNKGSAWSAPVGLSLAFLLFGLGGMILAWWRNRRLLVFWLTWSAPYVVYEVLLGRSPDFGVYVVFVLPAVMPFCGIAITWCASRIAKVGIKSGLLIGSIVVAVCVGVLVWPSVGLFTAHWNQLDRDAVAHFTAPRLAAAGAREILPPSAIVFQPWDEDNVNIIPYYAARRPIQRIGPAMYVLEDLGSFTPMNISSYRSLSPADLASLIADGIPVYTFESAPLRNMPDPIRARFLWQQDVVVDLRSAAALLGVPDNLAEQLPQGEYVLYRGSLLEGTSDGQ